MELYDQIKKAVSLLKTGDQAHNNLEFKKALANFSEAIGIAAKIPESEWDKAIFIAVCQARLSGTYFGLDDFEKSLECAEKALKVLDNVGHLYPTELGWWFGAKYHKGVALANLAKGKEGIRVLKEARKMLPNSNEYDRFRLQCDQTIRTVEDRI